MTSFTTERFTPSYHDSEIDRRGGWSVTEWLSYTYSDQGEITGRSGKKVTDCSSEEVAVNLATTLNLKWKLENEQD